MTLRVSIHMIFVLTLCFFPFQQLALSTTAISRYKNVHQWSHPLSTSSAASRRIRTHIGSPCINVNFISTNSRHADIKIYLSTSSSGCFSPQLSCSSPLYLSKKSTPCHAPPLLPSPSSEIHHARRPPRIQVSSLLADPHTRTYQLEVIQHPISTAAFGTANLSRLALTPPIIVQLTIRDPSGNSIVPQAELPFLIAHLSLYSGDGRSLDMGSSIGRNHTPPILYGNIVSSVEQLEDLQGNLGLFFLFPDVSIRWRGQYQLGISLFRMYSPGPLTGASLAPENTTLAETRTQMFEVVDQGEYSAAPPTRLTQCFLRQGARMFTYRNHP
ncbi:hypothetical protein AX15_003556 [Amanita polypyramis BW_CC]|nr:hypothetical protein AX15_003556 [Amanita polypyramis BW_CC]